jgi:hypothetical protein
MTKYRAIKLIRPTVDYSGLYSCQVSSLFSQDSKEQTMLVYGESFLQSWRVLATKVYETVRKPENFTSSHVLQSRPFTFLVPFVSRSEEVLQWILRKRSRNLAWNKRIETSVRLTYTDRSHETITVINSVVTSIHFLYQGISSKTRGELTFLEVEGRNKSKESVLDTQCIETVNSGLNKQ